MGAFIYSPPHSKLNYVLLAHLQYNFASLSAQYPGAGIILGGDVNNLDVRKICDTFPDLVNIVSSPTRGNRVLDVLVTNLHCGYDKAVIRPPVQPDKVGQGSASDHAVAVAHPNIDKGKKTGFSRKVVKERRVVQASSLALLVLFLATFDWTDLGMLGGVDAKLSYVNQVLFSAQDTFCPLEQFSVKIDRYQFASAKLAKLSRNKSAEYKKHGYSKKFKDLKKQCKAEIKCMQRRRINEAVAAGSSNNSWLGRLESPQPVAR